MVWTKRILHNALSAALLGGLLLVGGATSLHAADYYSCRRSVEKWESRLDYDINHHGVYSRQANHDRHELAEARESCDLRYGNRWR
jgi:hypothetical protein